MLLHYKLVHTCILTNKHPVNSEIRESYNGYTEKFPYIYTFIQVIWKIMVNLLEVEMKHMVEGCLLGQIQCIYYQIGHVHRNIMIKQHLV